MVGNPMAEDDVDEIEIRVGAYPADEEFLRSRAMPIFARGRASLRPGPCPSSPRAVSIFAQGSAYRLPGPRLSSPRPMFIFHQAHAYLFLRP